MKKLLLLAVLLLLTACDNIDDTATLEYCLENPGDVVCEDFDSDDQLDIMVNQLFMTMVEDHNDGGDFNCAGYFNTELAASCESDDEFFGPNEYTYFNLVETTKVDWKATHSYKAVLETNEPTDNIEILIGLEIDGEIIQIEYYQWARVAGEQLSPEQQKAIEFLEDYNDINKSSNTVCSTWINNSIDASNCELVRNSRLSSNNLLSFNKIEYFDVTFAVFNVGGESGENAIERYVMYSDGTFGTAEYVYQITQEFNTNSAKFINDVTRDIYQDFVACDLLDDGVSICNDLEDDISDLGYGSATFGVAGSNYYQNNELTYYLDFTVVFADESTRSFRLVCNNQNGNHIYNLIEN